MPAASWVSRLVGRAWFWILVLLAIVVLPVGRALSTRLPVMMPVMGEVPDFSLMDQNGHPFGGKDVRGRAWIVATLSPSAPGSEEMGQTIRSIQHRARHLGSDFHVVCITNRPEQDSPEDLAGFLRKEHASPRLWSFLTGDSAAVSDLLGRLSAASRTARPAMMLVDPQMRVRAVYDALGPDVVERVLRDVGLLVNRGG